MSFEIACAVNFPNPARTDSSENFKGPDASAGASISRGRIIPPGTPMEIRYFVWIQGEVADGAIPDTLVIEGVFEIN